MRFIIQMAPKGTAWSMHPRNNRKMPLQRADFLVSLQRVYIRPIKKYCYQLILGRFMILVAFSK